MDNESLALLDRRIARFHREHVARLLVVLNDAIALIKVMRKPSVGESLEQFRTETAVAQSEFGEKLRREILDVVQAVEPNPSGVTTDAVLRLVDKYLGEAMYVERFTIYEQAFERHASRFGGLLSLGAFRPDLAKSLYHVATSNFVVTTKDQLADDLALLVKRHAQSLSSSKSKAEQANLLSQTPKSSMPPVDPVFYEHTGSTSHSWDVFISHATEDKVAFAKPLAEALVANGLRVWYDEFTLTVGDSLRKSIDRGLAQSEFGVVVLSEAFFEKHWSQLELDGLVAREVPGRKVILPVWHGIDVERVRHYSPLLADRLAVSSALGIEPVVAKLMQVIRPAMTERLGTHQRTNPHADSFERLKREVIYTSIVNNLPVVLHKLRAFFIEADLVASPGFSEFYAQWLTQSFVEIGAPVLVPGFFSSERVAQLKAQLGELQF